MTPQQISEKWGRNLGNSAESMRSGADGVDTSPGVLAADNISRYAAGVQKALSSGKTEARMRAVSLEDWKARYKGKGITNATAAASDQTTRRNVEQFHSELQPVAQRIKQKAREMRANGASSLQRVAMAMEEMEKFGQNRNR